MLLPLWFALYMWFTESIIKKVRGWSSFYTFFIS
jgi:hypothetical protein